MSDYVVFADSACDIEPDTLKEWGVECVSLIFKFEDDEKEYLNDEMPAKVFYDKMRAGGVATTSAVNMENFKNAFRPTLVAGKDILYLGFSSGLSTTYNSARMAAEELAEEFPDRKIIAVDTLAASAGYGLLLYLTLEEKKKGVSIEQAAEYAEKTKTGLCHWFTVDDLNYLKRGGRVSPAVAMVGSLLGIKPILHVDDEGHLIKISTVRGRNASLSAIADKIGELADGKPQSPVFISHGDCPDDVEILKGLVKEKYGLSVDMVVNVGTVIGAHSGPGTMALFFIGKER